VAGWLAASQWSSLLTYGGVEISKACSMDVRRICGVCLELGGRRRCEGALIFHGRSSQIGELHRRISHRNSEWLAM